MYQLVNLKLMYGSLKYFNTKLDINYKKRQFFNHNIFRITCQVLYKNYTRSLLQHIVLNLTTIFYSKLINLF